MRLPVAAFLLLTAVFARGAINPPTEPPPFTAKELAQGFRERVILARPKASQRGSVDAAEAREGVRVRERIARFRDLRIIDLDAGDDAESAIARLRATGRYEFVEPDYIRHIAAAPNDPSYATGGLWPLNNTGLSAGIPGTDIDAGSAWDILHDAPNVIVAVVDTGVNLAHEDFAGNLWVNPAPTIGDVNGIRIVGGSRSGDPTDDNGHGTHVAGTIGAVGNNGVGIAGVAWRVQIMAIKVFPQVGSGSFSDIAQGINYAISHGAHIINASYGALGSSGFSQTEMAALSAAHEAGIIVVAAAGNSAANMDVTRFYPASHALDNIVTVGNSTRRDELSLSSNYGSVVDLFAPGSEIVSLTHTNSTGTALKSGTSMAAPHVAGALALLKARYPGDNYRQSINRLLRGVELGDRFAGKAQTNGRLNLLGALTAASNLPFNDDFAGRPRLNGDNLAIRTSNAGATAEPGEPGHAGSTANRSLWWEWASPVTGTITLDTAGSGYDTTLAVYTGSASSALTLVASNDNHGLDSTSRLSFPAQLGVTYQFAVDGKSGQSGLTLFNLGSTPANDAFATPVPLAGESAQLSAANLHCSREAGEPRIAGWPGGLSLWYRWTAPRTGRFQISVASTDFDPLLGVYTGTALASLSTVAVQAGTTESGALCTIEATAGTSYAIGVDSRSAGNAGQFTLSLTDSLWQAGTTDSITGAPAVASDGTLYVGSTDHSLYAFAPDGSLKWTYATSGLIDTCSPAVADDGTVYFGSNDGRLYAVSSTGSLKWTHDFGLTAPVSNSPALATDGTIYVKAGDGYLYALNPSDGSTKWRFNVNGPLTYASPSVAPDGTIYQGSENKVLYAINPDGSQKWSYTSDNEIYSVPAIDAAGNVYFTVLNSGKLYSVTSAGALRWVFSGASQGSSSSPALSQDGATAYFGGYDSKLHAVNTANGTARWAYSLGAEVRASSPAVDANGVVYIGCYDFKLYAVNFDGTLKRTYSTGNWIRSSPAISGTTLYVGSNDHKLYAFELGVGVAGGPWPQYRQNARRLGRFVPPPHVTGPLASQTLALGSGVTFIAPVGDSSSTYEWRVNGAPIPGAGAATLTLENLQPANAGVYSVVATNGPTSVVSEPAVVGIGTTSKVVGAGTEVGSNIFVAANNNTFDQVLLQGAAATITADTQLNQITRISFVDLNNDIVQVEFSGAGTLSLVLAQPTGPANAVNYIQPSIQYMKGHAAIVITGANETTHVAVFTVGTITAVNQSLFHSPAEVAYDGVADIAYLAIQSTNGRFGSIRAANAAFFNTRGLTGVFAPGVQVDGPVRVGDIYAQEGADPVLRLGSAAEVTINGGDLEQANGRAVQVSGLSELRFVNGSNSHGTLLPARPNRGRLEQNGADVTTQIVVDPSP